MFLFPGLGKLVNGDIMKQEKAEKEMGLRKK